MTNNDLEVVHNVVLRLPDSCMVELEFVNIGF